MKTTLLLFFIFSATISLAVTRIKNPCWNTRLTDEMDNYCQTKCLPNAVHEAQTECAEEQEEVDACLSDLDNCPNYDDYLTMRDNCETQLVIECFNNYK